MSGDLVGWAFEGLARGPYDPVWRRASWDGRTWDSEAVATEPAKGLILSWNALTPPGTGVAFEVSVRIAAQWTAWTPLGEWGNVPPVSPVESPVRREVDTATWDGQADAVRARARAFGDGGQRPRLKRVVVACRTPSGATPCTRPPHPGSFVADVPFRSQTVESPEVAKRICGPTSLAMQLSTIHPDLSTGDVAVAAYDRRHDLYGNWPHLAAAAGERGFVSWVQQFQCLLDVEDRLVAGYGAILSIAFEQGELDGAPIPRSDGHLLVLRGWDGQGASVCNDPAFPDERGDGVRYRRDQLERAWALHGGATILLRPE